MERKLIEHAISEGRPAEFFAESFAADEESIRWHKEHCLGRRPIPDSESGHQERFTMIRDMREYAADIAREARADPKQWRTALSAITTVARMTAVEDKLHDKTRRRGVRLRDTAEWQELKLRILQALEPYEDARNALAEALDDQP